MAANAMVVPQPPDEEADGQADSQRRPSTLMTRLSRIAPFNSSELVNRSGNFTSRRSVTEVTIANQRGTSTTSTARGEEAGAPATQATRQGTRSDGVDPPTSPSRTGSNRSLLRRVSNSSLLRASPVVVTELWKEFRLVKRNIISGKPWMDGLSVMWIVVSNTITSVLVAWLFAFLYAYSAPFVSTQQLLVQRHASLFFTTAVGAFFVCFACLCHTITFCYIIAERLQVVQQTVRHAFRRTLTEYLRSTAHWILLATVAGGGAMALLHQAQVDFISTGRMQLPLLCMVAGLYVDYVIRQARQLRNGLVSRMQTDVSAPSHHRRRSSGAAPSIEALGAALDSSNAVVAVAAPPAAAAGAPLRRLPSVRLLDPSQQIRPSWQRLTHGGRGSLVVSFLIMFGYMQVSLVLPLDHQWQVMLFAAFSLSIKIAIQEATKQLHLQAWRKPSARTTHMIITLPTVLIDAQIRMVVVQLGVRNDASSSSSSTSVLTSSLIIVVCKILFRFAKILRLRHTITQRLTKSKGMQRILKRVNSKIAVRDIATARTEYSLFLDWKNHTLRLHAAEVFADMHGEYISIGLAMAIVFFWTNHPMYCLLRRHGNGDGDATTTTAIHTTISRQMGSALVQLGVGLVFDYIASVVEGVHEVPLYEAIGDEGRGLRVFMHVLLGTLTAVNVGVIAVFLLRG